MERQTATLLLQIGARDPSAVANLHACMAVQLVTVTVTVKCGHTNNIHHFRQMQRNATQRNANAMLASPSPPSQSNPHNAQSHNCGRMPIAKCSTGRSTAQCSKASKPANTPHTSQANNNSNNNNDRPMGNNNKTTTTKKQQKQTSKTTTKQQANNKQTTAQTTTKQQQTTSKQQANNKTQFFIAVKRKPTEQNGQLRYWTAPTAANCSFHLTIKKR